MKAPIWHLIIGLSLLVGCGGAKKEAKAPEPEPPRPEATKEDEEDVTPRGTIKTGPAKTTRYPQTGPREPQWTAEWRSGEIKVGDEGVSDGLASVVKGEVMRDGKRIATYRANQAKMTRAINVLALRGDVVVTSEKPKGELRCAQLEYHPDRAAFRAWGPIAVRSPQGTMRTDGQMWFSDDMRSFGDASMFPVVKKKR